MAIHAESYLSQFLLHENEMVYKSFYQLLLVAKEEKDRKMEIKYQQILWDFLTLWNLPVTHPEVQRWEAETKILGSDFKKLFSVSD